MTPIFVFGSNTEGRHGRGAALFARLHRGAIYGVGEGLQGSSYGIPTRDGSQRRITSLPLWRIEWHVVRFLAFALVRPDLTFEVTKIGCGLGGYHEWQIAPMFAGAPANCEMPDGWR
ncbi:hypothetical protein [Methylobacterium ajmalii]|uniref:A1S_2505 family phage non-structural protein n=1 Tax=Methylobacterium ajmalii TaxID=2738439 RepID=UPI002F351F29